MLIVIGLATILLRLRAYGEPPNRDLATYAVTAREMLAGRSLYSDLWDHKPPLIYVSYALAGMVVGFGPVLFYVLNLSCNLVTMLAIWHGTRRLASSAAALLAAALFAVCSGDLYLQANEPNAEAFINALLAWCFAFLVRTANARAFIPIVIAGVLLGTASLFKTVVIVHAVTWGAVLFLVRPLSLRFVSVFAAGAIIPWLVALLWFAAAGTLRAILDVLFVYNAHYATMSGGSTMGNIISGLLPQMLMPLFICRVLLPLAAFSVAGALLARRAANSREMKFLLAWIVATPIAVALPGQFFPHYYQLWLPPLCIAAAVAAIGIAKTVSAKNTRAAHAVPAVLLAVCIVMEIPSYFFSAEQGAAIKYGPDPLQEKKVGQYLRTQLAPGETFYQWGTSATLYYASQTSPPTGIFILVPLLPGPLSKESAERVLRDLEKTKPRLAVMDKRDVPPMPNHPVERYLSQHYKPRGLDPETGRYLILERTQK